VYECYKLLNNPFQLICKNNNLNQSRRTDYLVLARVARWFILRPKIPIWVHLGGLGIEKVGIF
jgi:hypothetical protein